MKILCIYGSPRQGGNTDILMEEFIKGVENKGGEVIRVKLREKKISPCQSCGYCKKEGICVQKDDMQNLYPLLSSCEGIAIASPVFFLSLPAQVKSFIDRCEVFWVRKYIKGEKIREREGRGVFISTAGFKEKEVFFCAEKAVKAFFNVLGVTLWHSHFFGGIEEKGQIRNYPHFLKEVYRSGEELMFEIDCANLSSSKKEGRNESTY